MWTYQGAGAMPEVPGAPMRDLTDDEHEGLCDRFGAAAIAGVYTKSPGAAVADPVIEAEEEEQD